MIDFITVVYRPEICYLEIQARSIELYVDQNLINNIIIVVNDSDDVPELIDLNWYGKNKHKVKIIPYSSYGYNFTNRVSGWDNQQLCKILAASKSTQEWSVVLDAKTNFVNPCNRDTLFDSENKAATGIQPPSKAFNTAKEFVEKIFNISLTQVIGPGGVPFIFHTTTVQSMIEECAELSDKTFIDFFLDNVVLPNHLTEFVLYSGYVQHKYGNLTHLHSKIIKWSCINIADWELEKFDNLLNSMKSTKCLTASVQGKAWKLLSPEQQVLYLDFLQSKHIITDSKNTQIKLNTVIN